MVGNNRPSKNTTILIYHVTSRNHVIEEICDFVVRHMTSNHKPCKNTGHLKVNLWPFPFDVSLCDHVINRLCDLVDNRLALEPTTLSGLVIMCLAEVKI